MKILLVIGNAAFARKLKDFLGSQDLPVVTARNGNGALEAAQKHGFDLALVDNDLPDIPGTETIRKLSALFPGKEYVLFILPEAVKPAGDAVKKMMISSFLTKPVDENQLLSMIGQIREKILTAGKLRAFEEQFRIFSESVTDAFITFDGQGNIISVSPVFETIFGYKADEITGKPLKKIIPSVCGFFPKPGKKSKQKIRVEMPLHKMTEVTGIRKNGIEIPLEICISQYYTSEGVVYTSIIRDVTERKVEEVKTQLRLETEKIASLISERFVGIADFEQAVDDTLRDIGQYCDASRTFLLIRYNVLKNTRLTYDWLISESLSKKHRKKSVVPVYEKFIREFATGQDLIITDLNKIPESDEAMRTFLSSAGINSLFLLPLFAKGSLIGYWGMDNFTNPGDWTVEKFNLLVVISNIFSSAFHRRCVEQDLAVSEEIHRILLNASQEGIAIIDRKGVITEVSDITVRLFGYTKKEEITGKNYLEFVPKNLHKTAKEIFTKTSRGGIIQNVETEFCRADETLFSAEVSTTLIPEAGGSPRGFLLAIRDITQRKTVEKQLIHTERMAGIGEMAAGIAHEINQPLNTISLTLDNLLFSFRNGEFDKEYVEMKTQKLFQNITRMRNIIDHVRTFSRQNDDYILGNFNVNDSILNAVSMVSEQFKNKGIHLILNLDDNLRMPFGNIYRFEQVILNLIINARDALEEKKKHLQKDFNKTIEISTFDDGKNIRVEVKDNGTGIAPDKIDKVFLPFYTTKPEGSGTGLGLSISFGIIKDMHGTIEAISTWKKETTVRITIPLKGNETADPVKKPDSSKTTK